MPGDTAAAIDFLYRWEPEGPWVLTAIHPITNKIDTITFTPIAGPEPLTLWIDAQQGTRNVYFSPARAKGFPSKKTTKADIDAVPALHVDLDPRPGEGRVQIEVDLRAYDPPPSVIVCSGGGLQGYWLLAEPQLIRSLADIERIEAYNRRIRDDLGADHCQNIDRIMRLPGTINLPSKKKLEQGRQRAPAYVIEAHWDRRYSLDQFTAAEPVTKSNGAAERGEWERCPLPDWCDYLIASGDTAQYGGDRSRAVFKVACTMVRCGCTDTEIAQTLADPSNGISAHVREQRDPERYAARQAERAREYSAAEPSWVDLNAPYEGSMVSATEQRARSSSGWLDIVDITAEAETVPAFPTELLPQPWQNFVADVVDRMQVPPEFPAVPLIVEAGAMLGRDVRIMPKRHDDWFERACLWGGIIATPGAKKSPAIAEALRPIIKIQKEAHERYRAARASWEEEKDGPPPLPERMLTNEATVEKLAPLLSADHTDNPRGVLLYRDELSGWLDGMNKYRRGDDRQFFLEAWSGGAYTVDRVKGSIFVDDLFLAIVGAIQPDVAVRVFRDGDVDGLTARFGLLVYPAIPEKVDVVDRQPNFEARKEVERRLRGMREIEKTEPLRFSGEAYAVFNRWLLRNENRPEKREGSAFGTHIAKYPGLFGSRLALHEGQARARGWGRHCRSNPTAHRRLP